MDDALKRITGLEVPYGVPSTLAVMVALHEFSEEDARRLIDEDYHEDPEQWIVALRNAGFFSASTVDNPATNRVSAQTAANNLANRDQQQAL
jgi:hypothetical protein